MIIIPNGPLSTGVISNFNIHGNLRVDLTFGIALNQDIDKAKEVIQEAMAAHPDVLQIFLPLR